MNSELHIKGIKSREGFERYVRGALCGGQEGGLADLALNVHGLLVL